MLLSVLFKMLQVGLALGLVIGFVVTRDVAPFVLLRPE
jgi:hypothetical protein